MPATPGTPGYLPDYKFAYDPGLAKELLAKSNFGPNNPAKIGFAATNGQFPSDYDIARAIVQMWKEVGIDADLQTIEYAKYFELNRGDKLPEATLYSWDNATGDPEIFAGYLLNPKLPFSAWKGDGCRRQGARSVRHRRLQTSDRRLQGARTNTPSSTARPFRCCKACRRLVRKKSLQYEKFGNGWVLANTMTWA